MTVFNSENSPIQAKRGKTFTTHLTIDANDNIWFTDGYNGYRFDHEEWTVFDTLNYPLRWTIGIEPDSKGNVYFRTFQGIRKYNGESWSIIDKSNAELPMERISGIYVDRKNRMWIGTYGGNIRIDDRATVKFEDSENPLSQASISKMYEDSKGNLWFDLYNKDKTKAGIWLLKPNGEWTSIRPKNSKLFTENDVNDFLLDEENEILWIALNSVGLIRYDIQNDKWETYTPENSNVPSIHVMKLTKDKNGTIWAATFAGIIKMNEK
jgi:ligand-binding sensor domain-containing protein